MAAQARRLQLLDLPTEILFKVLVTLPAQDLLLTTLVASPFYRLVKEHVYLRYILELHRHGLVDCVPPALGSADGSPRAGRSWTTAQKLERLFQREKNWHDLQAPSVTVTVSGATPIYELQSGVYVRGEAYTPSPGSLSERPQALEVYPLPSFKDAQGGADYRKVDVQTRLLNFDVGPYLDLTLDPAENLICVVKRHNPTEARAHHRPSCRQSRSPFPTSRSSFSSSVSEIDVDLDGGKVVEDDEDEEACNCGAPSYELHLFGMDGLPRRDVASNVLLLDVVDRNGFTPEELDFDQVDLPAARFLLQICGDTLAVMVGGATEGEKNLIQCWNWRSSEVLCRHEYLAWDMPDFIFTSFLLLTPTSYVLSNLPSHSAVASLQIFDFAFGTARLVSTLELPELNSRILRLPIPLFFELRPDPPSSASERIWGLEGDWTTRPFATDPGRGIINLDITIGDQSFHFHFLKETLMKELQWGSKGRLRRWEEWGPQNCRAWQGFTRRHWVTHIHGYRCVQVFPATAPSDDINFTARELRLFDFNPLHFPARKAASEAEDELWHFNTKPNYILKRQIWEEDVYTELPFRTAVVSTLTSNRRLGVMLDEDHIITTLSAENGQDWHFVVQAM